MCTDIIAGLSSGKPIGPRETRIPIYTVPPARYTDTSRSIVAVRRRHRASISDDVVFRSVIRANAIFPRLLSSGADVLGEGPRAKITVVSGKNAFASARREMSAAINCF